MKVRATVQETGDGLARLRKVEADLRRDAFVKVGVIDEGEGAADRGGITNAELAAIHEFGTADGRIPARPFVTLTVDGKREEIKDTARALVLRMVEGKLDLARALGLLGAKVAADMKATIKQGDQLAPNAPSTVAGKGSSRPLVDTGQMVNSITWKVEGA